MKATVPGIMQEKISLNLRSSYWNLGFGLNCGVKNSVTYILMILVIMSFLFWWPCNA